MAYLDFAVHAGLGVAPVAAAREDVATALSPLEWSVVTLARRDGRASIRPSGFLSRLARLVAGGAPKTPLSNPRLEALRRFAVLAWTSARPIASEDRNAFLAAGFSAGQTETLLSHVGAARALAPRRFRA
ncbi:hypothetical protein [Sphingomonas sp.]|uniref:hypothetical protein n=1 Tax=Sphingomonas sp. TaxID=28214 RepID=UPI001B2BAD84|nr:hypothetical protein [Sphingomonas sp.]MBO9712957.1 hypothetical protein [Sphingomonas sp.]